MGKKPAQKSIDSAKESKVSKKEVKAQVEKKEAVHSKSHSSSLPREEMKCKTAKCKRDYKAKGYCTFHYKQWRQGKFGMARYNTCKESECRKPATLNRFGYCETHFQNYYVKGVAVPKAEAPAKETKAPVEKVA